VHCVQIRQVLNAIVTISLADVAALAGKEWKVKSAFYHTMRVHSADDAVARCPSVRLSHADIILSKLLNISSNFFKRRVATPF